MSSHEQGKLYDDVRELVKPLFLYMYNNHIASLSVEKQGTTSTTSMSFDPEFFDELENPCKHGVSDGTYCGECNPLEEPTDQPYGTLCLDCNSPDCPWLICEDQGGRLCTQCNSKRRDSRGDYVPLSRAVYPEEPSDEQ